jgi:hypothetical protein
MAAGGRKNADDALATALAGGAPVRAAAERAGVSERTAYRRLADAAFRLRVAGRRAEMAQQAVGRMVEGMADAADTLRRLLASAGDAVKLGAARSILELGAKLREAGEFEERLLAVEQRLQVREGRG